MSDERAAAAASRRHMFYSSIQYLSSILSAKYLRPTLPVCLCRRCCVISCVCVCVVVLSGVSLVPGARIGHVLARQSSRERLRGWPDGRIWCVGMKLGGQFSDSVGQHVLFHVALRAKALIAEDTLEGALLCVAPVVDFERAITGECLEAELAGCVGPRDAVARARRRRRRRRGARTERQLRMLIVVVVVAVVVVVVVVAVV